MSPSDLPFPVYLLNFPFTVSNAVINNELMEAYREQSFNHEVAFRQWMGLYKELVSRGALVYILPSEGNFQDQVYVANVGCYLPHTDATLVISNFKSIPRQGEEKVAEPFFHSMGYNLIKPVTTFEGEADLKWLRDNIYVGGYGIRTDIRTHYWLEDVTGAEITKIEMNDGGLYHFDCMFLPLTHEKALVATQAIKPDDLRKLEKLVEIIPVPVSYLYFAWTNCLVFGKEVLYGPATPELGNAFGDYISKYGYEPIIVELTEFEKSGAALSCACMHLNYKARLNK